MKLKITRKDFPADFIFGVSTSSYQIEGSAYGGAGKSHWDTFAATPGNVQRGENGAHACDHYHRWQEDLDLVKNCNFDAYRFSINWARVIPEGTGTVNPQGLDFYDRLLDGILERGLKPFPTLYHWDLPATLAMKGGWTNRDIAKWFADYTQIVMTRLGDRLNMIATINEPWCVAWLSHFLGQHAPGIRDIRATAHAMHNVLLAHGTALEAIRAENKLIKSGIVLNFEYPGVATSSSKDRAAATRQDAIYNRWFIEAITKKSYPQEALEGLAPHMPANWQDDFDIIAKPLDWLGVNYYTRVLHCHSDGLWPATGSVVGELPKTTMGWEIYPDGLREILLRLSKEYVGDLPIFVTENGMSRNDTTNSNGEIDDPERIDYIERHLAAAREALANGINLRGFFYWSLLDNYEWALGYEKRFGLIHVDFATQKRIPKNSYKTLVRALAT